MLSNTSWFPSDVVCVCARTLVQAFKYVVKYARTAREVATKRNVLKCGIEPPSAEDADDRLPAAFFLSLRELMVVSYGGWLAGYLVVILDDRSIDRDIIVVRNNKCLAGTRSTERLGRCASRAKRKVVWEVVLVWIRVLLIVSTCTCIRITSIIVQLPERTSIIII